MSTNTGELGHAGMGKELDLQLLVQRKELADVSSVAPLLLLWQLSFAGYHLP